MTPLPGLSLVGNEKYVKSVPSTPAGSWIASMLVDSSLFRQGMNKDHVNEEIPPKVFIYIY